MADILTATPWQSAQKRLKDMGDGSFAEVTAVGLSDTNGTVTQPALSSTFWNYAPGTGGVVPSTGQTAAKAAGAAGVRNYVMSAQISHAALGASVELLIQDGSTTLWRGSLGTAATDAGGFTINFDPPLRGTAATAVNYTFSAATTGGVYVNLQGFTGA